MFVRIYEFKKKNTDKVSLRDTFYEGYFGAINEIDFGELEQIMNDNNYLKAKFRYNSIIKITTIDRTFLQV